MADSTHGRVRRVRGDGIGVTLAGTEHVMSDGEAVDLAGRIAREAGLPDGAWKIGLSTSTPPDAEDAVAAARAEIVERIRKRADECPAYEDWGIYLHQVADEIERCHPEPHDG